MRTCLSPAASSLLGLSSLSDPPPAKRRPMRVISLSLLLVTVGACVDDPRATETDQIVLLPAPDAGVADDARVQDMNDEAPDCGPWRLDDAGFTCAPAPDPPCDGVPVPGGCIAPFECLDGWRRDGPLGCSPAPDDCDGGPASPAGICLGRWRCPVGWTQSPRGGCVARTSPCLGGGEAYPGGCVDRAGVCDAAWPAETVFVDSAAGADGDGTRERPLRRLSDALARAPRVVAVRGEHSGGWQIAGPVRIGGCPGARLRGQVTVSSDEVHLHDLQLEGTTRAAVEVEPGGSVVIERSVIRAGPHYAVFAQQGAARLEQVGVTLVPAGGSGLGIVSVGGALHVDRVAIEGTGAVALATDGSALSGGRLQIGSTDGELQVGLILQRGEVQLADLDLRHLGALGVQTLHVDGAIRRLRVEGVRFAPQTPGIVITGVGVAMNGSNVTLDDLVLLDLEAVGLDVTTAEDEAPVQVVARRVLIDASANGAQARLGSDLTLDGVFARVADRSATSLGGGRLTLADGRVAGGSHVLLAVEPDSVLHASGVVVRGRPDAPLTVGAHAQDGGTLTIVDGLIEDLIGIGAGAALATLELHRTKIQRIHAGADPGAGLGIAADAAQVELRSVSVVDFEHVGVAVQRTGLAMEPVEPPRAALEGISVRMDPAPLDDDDTVGLLVDGVRLEVERLAVAGGRTGVRVRPGSTLSAARVDIRDTRQRGEMTARGLWVSGAAEVSDVSVSDGDGVGYLMTAGGRLRCTRCQARRLAPDARGVGRGVGVQEGRFDGDLLDLAALHGLGIFVATGAHFEVDHVTIRDVAPRAIGVGGAGLAVDERSAAIVGRLRIAEVHRSGVEVINQSSLSVDRLWISGVADSRVSGVGVRVDDAGRLTSGWTRIEGSEGASVVACAGQVDLGHLVVDAGPVRVAPQVFQSDLPSGAVVEMCDETDTAPARFEPTDPFEAE